MSLLWKETRIKIESINRFYIFIILIYCLSLSSMESLIEFLREFYTEF